MHIFVLGLLSSFIDTSLAPKPAKQISLTDKADNFLGI